MKRDRTTFLINWLRSASRKPLVIKGARQVGKTWLIRDLASSERYRLVELNFEKRPDLESLFSSNDPKDIMTNLAALTGSKIEPLTTILFLDEIQAAPHLLAKLRWFAEDMPELAVIAAGSLLDFALAQHEFSMPVGRIGYMYLEPLSFEEFLDAMEQGGLRTYLQNYDWKLQIPEALHTQLMKALKEYLVVGGMPAAVSSWAREKVPEVIHQIHFDLLATYRDDFAKYSGRLSISRLEDIMNSVPRQLGQKFVYRKANSEVGSTPLKQALDLLSKARVCHPIVATSANGLPLGAEADEKFFKVILLDSGLCSAALGLSLHQMQTVSDITMINSGGMAEQLVGQMLRTTTLPYIPPSLYYWQREKKGAEAEIDYIIQHEHLVLPIEVKAGTTGTLRSLHRFMEEKKKPIAVRVNADLPTVCSIAMHHSSEYSLLSIPFYLVGQIHRLIPKLAQESN
ncbi:MAG TPA: AAA family ATPase [Chlamydiales bacterium]|jgi:predicted AAA+ superfamily ATPase|nr:AAA family ATPase [Chlamydiales bacterium]